MPFYKLRLNGLYYAKIGKVVQKIKHIGIRNCVGWFFEVVDTGRIIRILNPEKQVFSPEEIQKYRNYLERSGRGEIFTLRSGFHAS